MEVIRSSEMSVHLWTTLRHIPEDGNILVQCMQGNKAEEFHVLRAANIKVTVF
jgi:hypothetical protein